MEVHAQLFVHTCGYDSIPSELEGDVMDNFRGTADPGITIMLVEVSGSSGVQPWVGVRHKVTTDGVDDYSEISAMQTPLAIG